MTDPVEELNTMFPDRPLNVGGREIIVRAFRFAEGLRMTAVAKPIVQRLGELIGSDGDRISGAAVIDVLVAEEDAWLALIGQSTGQPVEWIRGLTDSDGLALAMTFWDVNQDFFTTRLELAMVDGLLGAAASESEKSSTSSSEPATDATPETSQSG